MPEPADVYSGLRRQVLELQPADAGIVPAHATGSVWGAMMETAYPSGVATLVCLADGTTSLYTSTGGGMIGAGGHASVVAANHAFREAISSHVGQLAPEPVANLPQPGNVILRALTFDGHLAATAPENDLGYGRHSLSPVFHAAHEVITELRQIDENSAGG
jgi:hypothetical protein